MLPILFQDEHLVIINKPSGLLVHRSMIDRHETRFALQMVRDQIGQRVYPIHRLDKPTSGVLVFALNSEVARICSELMQAGKFKKSYLAIVRGFAPESGHIDHPLKEELDKYTDAKARLNNPAKEAQTDYKCLAQVELPIAIDNYPQSRFSLVRCFPHTGRKHQIRRHLKHISHPIIGDAKHGKGKYNRYFAEHFGAGRLLLHANQLTFPHPLTGDKISVTAPLDSIFIDLFKRFEWLPVVCDESGIRLS
jgi:tRNA pseudouridine65 synthase